MSRAERLVCLGEVLCFIDEDCTNATSSVKDGSIGTLKASYRALAIVVGRMEGCIECEVLLTSRSSRHGG